MLKFDFYRDFFFWKKWTEVLVSKTFLDIFIRQTSLSSYK
jgi:hypothetical protein